MRKEKFTKGPWRVGPVDDTLVMDTNRREIAQSLGDHKGEDWESVYANTALIASAPDLYHALKQAASHIQFIIEGKEWGAIEEVLDDCNISLAKARGES